MNKEYYKKQLTIPNFLTTLRLFAIPYMVNLIMQKDRMVQSFVFFVLIWLTDIADGYIARNYRQISDLGKVYDPLVDKLFQLATALALFSIGRVPMWVVLFILLKELIMIIGGVLLWQKKTVVHSQWFGKVATVLYTFAFVCAFFLSEKSYYLNHILFLIPTICSALALFMYAFYYQNDLK